MEIVLIDRYPLMRSGIRVFLNNEFENISIVESASFTAFDALVPALTPDIIIFGVGQFSKSNDLEVLLQIKNNYDIARVIVYDEVLDLASAKQFLDLGIGGYLSKQCNFTQLADCIRSVRKSIRYVGGDLIELILSEVKFTPGGKPENLIKGLTKREFLIATYLAEGYKTSGISQELGVKPSTISIFKNKIYKKLKVDNVINLREAIQSIKRQDKV